MEIVFEDNNKRKITSKEEIIIPIKTSGLYIIELSGRTKGEQQLNSTDDEDLKVEFLGQKYPSNSPASFSGGQLHGSLKTVYFISLLEVTKYKLLLVPDKEPLFEGLRVWRTDSAFGSNLEFALDRKAEDRDRRPWITFVLVNLALETLFVKLRLTRHLLDSHPLDSDDVKVTVDGKIKRNYKSRLWKYWYFITSLLGGETQNETFNVNLPIGDHFLEFDADRTPTFMEMKLQGILDQPSSQGENSIQDNIRSKAREYGLDPNLMLRIAEKESGYNPKAVSPQGAKGLFQLTDITIRQISTLGYEVVDPYNSDQNINGGMIYFRWLLNLYKDQQDSLEKTIAAWNWGMGNFSKEGPFDFNNAPEETRNFINFVLQR